MNMMELLVALLLFILLSVYWHSYTLSTQQEFKRLDQKERELIHQMHFPLGPQNNSHE
jgi:hypothetical protein